MTKSGPPSNPGSRLKKRDAEKFARLALDSVHREYPNKIGHVMTGDADARPPRELTPAFYGCFDWHSAVHGHWLLARVARAFPGAAFSRECRASLEQSLQESKLEGEVRYMHGEGRAAFERPYGLAWLLQLAAELREWDDAQAARWAKRLEPLEALAAERLTPWIRKLPRPIRTGEHGQTAFAFGLILDWAGRFRPELAELLHGRILELYGPDRNAPLAYEPSAHDFLSPSLAEADLMRRLLRPTEFAAWLSGFLPQLPTDGSTHWLLPVSSPDPADGHLAHLDGLNLSRAWMLEGIGAGLPPADPRQHSLRSSIAAHREAGLRSVTAEHYEGSHWLGTFAVYLETARGLS